MSASERVIAILCSPLGRKDLLEAEQTNNVIIHRKIEYSPREEGRDMLKKFRWMPMKLMFIFSIGEAIVINTQKDWDEVGRRLLTM